MRVPSVAPASWGACNAAGARQTAQSNPPPTALCHSDISRSQKLAACFPICPAAKETAANTDRAPKASTARWKHPLYRRSPTHPVRQPPLRENSPKNSSPAKLHSKVRNLPHRSPGPAVTAADAGALFSSIFPQSPPCFAAVILDQTLNRKLTTSPSCMTYSLPSLRSRPLARAAARVWHTCRSSKATTSARIKPRSKSVWILPAA